MEAQTQKASWFGNVRGDLLSGTVVALALVPEAIAFSIIAGVDPMVGLYASFIISVVIAFVGGRPGMISGATGIYGVIDGGFGRRLWTFLLTGSNHLNRDSSDCVWFAGAGWVMYAMVIGALAIIYLLPYVSKVVPSALVAIVVITTIALL